MHDCGMKIKTAMRLATVQKDGDRNDGDVRKHQSDQGDLPPGKLQKTTGKESKDVVHRPFNAWLGQIAKPVLELEKV